MDEKEVVQEAMKEVRAANDEELRQVIEEWYRKTRTDGMRLGAQYMCAAVYGAIQKHVLKAEKPSLRDYKRMTDDILKVISVPMKKQDTQQNDSGKSEDHDQQAQEEDA